MEQEPQDPRYLAELPSTADIATTGVVAYVPNRVIVANLPAVDELIARFVSGDQELGGSQRSLVGGGRFVLFESDQPIDVIRLVNELRNVGVPAQPDHVFFAHDSGCCCCSDHPGDLLGNPLRGNPLRGNPLRGNPLRGNPLRGNPLRGNPLRGNPLRGNPLRGNGMPTMNSARPCAPREALMPAGAAAVPRVAVLDTGVAGVHPTKGIDFTPKLFVGSSIVGAVDVPDSDDDTWLDAIAGHGTFIAGLIELHAVGCHVEVIKVLSPDGAGQETAIAEKILQQAALPDAERPHFLNLSFGGYVLDNAPLLLSAVLLAQAQGIVVVASAGNDGICEPTYPAAFPGVVSVASIGPWGPSWFSNYGDWVRACAPGEEVVSAFFNKWDGPNPAIDGADKDRFEGWAEWSGTSFAAPMVVAALARFMQGCGCTPTEAVERLIDAAHLGRIPGMGAVVNL
jgi:Subtilase family